MIKLVKLGKQVFKRVPKIGVYVGTALIVCEITMLVLKFVDECLPVPDDDDKEGEGEDDIGDDTDDDDDSDEGDVLVSTKDGEVVSSRKVTSKNKVADEVDISTRLFEDEGYKTNDGGVFDIDKSPYELREELERRACLDGWLPHEMS